MTISVKIVADSVSMSGVRITTMELEYQRFCHAEFMTHRLFSRNAASSRAIPVKRAIELIQQNTAMPIHWGKNQPGMSAKEECDARLFNGENFYPDDPDLGVTREGAWIYARNAAIKHAEEFNRAGYHKQIVNRLLEPFTHMKVVVTATEWENFFWLRDDEAAQPEIRELARLMKQEMEASVPRRLVAGEWHTPYFREGFWTPDGGETLENALAVSTSCCAQVSYRRSDDSLEKAKDIVAKLMNGNKVHASPFEHQATPMDVFTDARRGEWQEGITHIDRNANRWSGNFREWIQHRQLIPNNVKM